MVSNFDSKNLKKLNNILFITSLVIINLAFINGNPQLQKSVDLNFKTTMASTDRDGNIYLVTNEDDIYKFDKNGKKLLVYSPQKMAETSLFEAWNSISLILFYKDFQEYTLLDRFLTFKSSGTVDQQVIGFARVMTLASDNNLWLIDDTDFSLKKYDLTFKNLKVHTALDLILDPKDYDITFIREYHNNVYVLDNKNGVLVFDNLGNYKRTLGLKGLDHIGFHNDRMYYAQQDSLTLFNLYDQSVKSFTIEGMHPKDPVIINSGKIYHVSGKALNIYSMEE